MQLPHNIWKMIVSYLPVGTVKKLYTVNSTLFDIAMDLRYGEAQLSTSGTKTLVRKNLRVFHHPQLSCRPKTLRIDLGSIAKSLAKEDSKTSLRRTIVNLATRSKLALVSEIGPDTLSRLTAVTNLYFKHDHSGPCCGHPLVLRLLRDVWKVFGNHLQSLQVRVAFENLEHLLPISLRLPCLKSLIVYTEGLNSITASACESIIPTMVQSHAPNLRNVYFTTMNAAVDLRPIFQSLQDLPHLRGIHLSFPFGPSVPRPFPVYHMLYSCRHHLEFLSLDFGIYMGEHASRSVSLFHEDWCFVDLPCLRELRINPPLMAFSQEFMDYIHRFAQSLVSLWIKPHLILGYQNTEQLSSIFCDFLSLQSLSINIDSFCPDILALLARTLPHLQTLTLGYSYVSHTTGYMKCRKFYQAMQQHIHVFRAWQLVSLDYFYLYYCRMIPDKRALGDHLPNVEWFCGVDRLTYINQAQEVA